MTSSLTFLKNYWSLFFNPPQVLGFFAGWIFFQPEFFRRKKPLHVMYVSQNLSWWNWSIGRAMAALNCKSNFEGSRADQNSMCIVIMFTTSKQYPAV